MKLPAFECLNPTELLAARVVAISLHGDRGSRHLTLLEVDATLHPDGIMIDTFKPDFYRMVEADLLPANLTENLRVTSDDANGQRLLLWEDDQCLSKADITTWLKAITLAYLKIGKEAARVKRLLALS